MLNQYLSREAWTTGARCHPTSGVSSRQMRCVFRVIRPVGVGILPLGAAGLFRGALEKPQNRGERPRLITRSLTSDKLPLRAFVHHKILEDAGVVDGRLLCDACEPPLRDCDRSPEQAHGQSPRRKCGEQAHQPPSHLEDKGCPGRDTLTLERLGEALPGLGFELAQDLPLPSLPGNPRQSGGDRVRRLPQDFALEG
jgi:hypothetical protein